MNGSSEAKRACSNANAKTEVAGTPNGDGVFGKEFFRVFFGKLADIIVLSKDSLTDCKSSANKNTSYTPPRAFIEPATGRALSALTSTLPKASLP